MLRKRLPYLLFALCIVLSLAFGSHIASVQRAAAQFVNALAPVGYDVTYYDSAAHRSVLAEGVQVRFGETDAVLSNGAVVAPDEAVFVCLDEALLARNIARTGALAIALGTLAVVLLLAMTALSLRLCMAALRRDLRAQARSARVRARRAALHAVPRTAPVRRSAA